MWQEKGATHERHQDNSWWWNKARSEIVFECMKNCVRCNSSILDVGAGYGGMVDMLNKFGLVAAVEPFGDAAKYLREYYGIKVYNTAFDHFKETEQYDIVTGFDVMEHIEDDRQALLKMTSLVKKGGLLVITVPAYQFLWGSHDVLNHHYRRYTKKGLIERLPAGIVIKRATYFNTLMFPAAVLDKLFFSRNKPSYALNPDKIIDKMLYQVFAFEKFILRHLNLPFGTSILLIANKQ